MKKFLRKALGKVILCVAIGLIAIFAIPLCLCIIPIMLIWIFTDKALKLLE